MRNMAYVFIVGLLLGTTFTYAGVTIAPPLQTPAGALLSSGVDVTIDVAIIPDGGSSLDSVGLIIMHDDGSRSWSVTNAMTLLQVSGNTWRYQAAIPPLNSGSVTWQVVARYDAGEVVTSEVVSYSIGELPGLADGRYMGFDTAWTQVEGSNYTFAVAAGEWSGEGMAFSSAGLARPDGGLGRVGQLLNIYGSYIKSPPLERGIGTIYYSARPRNPAHTQLILIQITTNSTPDEWEWETVKKLEFPRTTPQTNLAEPVVLNRFDIKRVRFILTEESPHDLSPDSSIGAVAFDNIVFSYPPADVAISERLRNPGYPSQDQETRMRCQVSDLNPAALTMNQRVTLYYQWVLRSNDRPQAGKWLSVAMAAQGDGLYEGVLPEQRPGFVHYYYKCEFDGYAYNRDPDGVNTPAGRPCIEPMHYENLSPRYWEKEYLEETVGHVPSFYGKLEVRRYRSEYGHLACTFLPSDSDLSFHAPLFLVGGHQWRGVAYTRGRASVYCTLLGYGEWTNNTTVVSSDPVYLLTSVEIALGGTVDVLGIVWDGTNAALSFGESEINWRPLYIPQFYKHTEEPHE